MNYSKQIKMLSIKCKFIFFAVFYLIATSSLVYSDKLDEQKKQNLQLLQQEQKLYHGLQIHPLYPVYHHFKQQNHDFDKTKNTESRSINENLKIQPNDKKVYTNNESINRKIHSNNNEEADVKPTMLSSSARTSSSNTDDVANINENGEAQQVSSSLVLDTTNYVATTPANLKLHNKNTSSKLEDSYDDEDDLNEGLNKQSSLLGGGQTSSTSNAIDTILSLIGMFMNTGKAEAKRKSLDVAEKRSSNITKESLPPMEASGVPNNEYQLADGSSDDKTEKNNGEGRYIKGDPINGYYDFVITEGSYKFWAAFQLATAALIIYSTLAAIYYSKVNPLVSDYEYVDYLSRRSFNGRSMPDDVDIVGPDDEDNQLPVTGRSDDGNSYWSSLVNSNWLGTAAHGFQFVLDAIDKVPQ